MTKQEENLKCIEIANEESRKMMEEYNKKCSISKSLKTRSFPSDLEIRILENSIRQLSIK